MGAPSEAIRRSRYCREFVDVGVALERARDWLLGRRGEEVLLACSDEALEVLARAGDELTARGYVLPDAEPEVVLAMLDKDASSRVARDAGLRVPAWTTVRAGSADSRLPPALLAGPCVLKPLRRHEFQQRTGSPEKVFRCSSPEGLRRQLESFATEGIDVMVTEIVPGREGEVWSYQSFVESDGRPAFDFTVRKLRQEPPHFGVASLAVGEWDADVVAAGRRFVSAAGVRGPVEVEFKRDARDGRVTFIECNHRLNFLGELVHRSGFDVALLTYRRATGGAGPALGPPVWGYRLWHPLMDVRALREYRALGELDVQAVVRSLAHPRICFTEWAVDDPALALDSACGVARRALRRTRRRLRGRS